MTVKRQAPPVVPLLLLPVAALLAGCETTQDKHDKIAAALGPVKEETGLVIKEQSKVVKVLDTEVLTSENGAAVVVEVKNTSDETLIGIPIGIDVLDAKGKSVYTNDVPGLQPGLVSIPLLRPGETLDWVNDQVLAVGEADDVKVEIGADAGELSGDVPEIEVGEAKLVNDAVSGVNATGSALNNTDEQQEVLLYGVARQGDQVVAAGRAVLDKVNPERERAFHIYFIGDPKGAELSVTAFPTRTTFGEEGGNDD